MIDKQAAGTSIAVDDIRGFMLKLGDESDIVGDNKITMGYLITLNRFMDFLGGGQSRNVGEKEAEYIRTLSKGHYTIGEIAVIVGRSKSTIHEVLSRQGGGPSQ